MLRRAPLALAVMLGVALGLAAAPPHAGALPACDLLRKCSGQLATAFHKSGFPARVIRQYRRNATTRFEHAEASQPGVCRKVLAAIVNNAVEMHRRGRLKYLPPACTRKALDTLP